MPWYEEFFDEDYMRFHLRGGGTQAERVSAECDFVVKAMELRPGHRILGLCCGQRVEWARAAGMRCVWMNASGGAPPRDGPQPDHVAATLRQAATIAEGG